MANAALKSADSFAPRWELPAIVLLAWLAFVAVPIGGWGMALSWDALNHHIYLGWIAQHSRFDRDFLAAGYQSLQFPYLYWPVYKLAALGAGPQLTGVVLASLHLLAVPPVWMIARTAIPGLDAYHVAMRTMAVMLAFLSGVVLSLLDSSSNDLLAAVPLVWATALAFAGAFSPSRWSDRQLTVASGVLAGVAVACKLSNAPLVLVLPLLWSYSGSGRARLFNMLLASVATALAFLLAYGYWGAQMWIHFGNPVYPFYDVVFAPLRAWTGWSP